MDLRDLWRGRMSYRRLWVLLNRLPQESWTQTELRDSQPDSALISPETGRDSFGPWALINYQAAALLDAVQRVAYVCAVAGALDPKPEAPKPTPRPGAKRSKVRAINPAAAAYLGRLRAPAS